MFLIVKNKNNNERVTISFKFKLREFVKAFIAKEDGVKEIQGWCLGLVQKEIGFYIRLFVELTYIRSSNHQK